MKVLISAFAYEPGAGSEPGAGWAWTRAAALDDDVWLLTVARNAEQVEAALVHEPGLRLHPVTLTFQPGFGSVAATAYASAYSEGPQTVFADELHRN